VDVESRWKTLTLTIFIFIFIFISIFIFTRLPSTFNLTFHPSSSPCRRLGSSRDPSISSPTTDFCSEEMLKGWAEDESNTLSSDEQFDRYLKFYNECFKVSGHLFTSLYAHIHTHV
jgi:hypothetical protein